MNIKIDKARALSASEELLDVSRAIRRSRVELDVICSQLRHQTELDQCRYELRKQEEAASIMTARLVALSSSLREVVTIYSRAEEHNADALEGETVRYRRSGQIRTKNLGNAIGKRINKILHQ